MGNMADMGDQCENELPKDIFIDEDTTNTGSEDNDVREWRRNKNTKRAKHRRIAIERLGNHRFRTPLANITEATIPLPQHIMPEGVESPPTSSARIHTTKLAKPDPIGMSGLL